MIAQESICFSIVSHGQGELVAALLADLLRLNVINPSHDEIVLTFNIPEDESFLNAFSSLPIRVLRNHQPKGFGANHNAAFKISCARIFAIVNPDVRLVDFETAPMLGILANRKVGLWAPRVISSDGKLEDSVRRFPTLLRFLRRVLLRQRNADYFAQSHPLVVDWVAGMFMALRRDTYSAIGGFDERYFMYLEDADLCKRLGKNNLQVVFDPRIYVVHDAQRASRRNWQHMRWHCRSAIRFLFEI
ncbi:glycosyltransferase [Pandoraea sp.]|uniref:glycosyltransferase n=1 Tax=Pandoraea sp. TaxID=1883445 RepID=UPI001222B724|nr:glycosyltransferase [Pandoraea sp.]TAL55379.1 MAG: glycosyltransferase family 2 protein [Pandoraea sp.]TAM15707.1 MAG: glycosyltransferase family 2 protein [Pandoraea sp.]